MRRRIELYERISLSVMRWHQHTNFCAAPADKAKEYHGDMPKFRDVWVNPYERGVRGGGRAFFPVMFKWMIHVSVWGEADGYLLDE